MDLSARVLGLSTVNLLKQKAATPLLVIGSDVFHRGDLAAVACFNFIAAQHLNKALRDLGVQNTKDVFENIPPSALVLPGVGSISLAVLGACFEKKKLGGALPLETWVAKHRTAAGSSRTLVTFDTLKHQEAKRSEGETRARKARARRTATRRDEAHRRRVGRFTLRRDKAASA